MARDPERIDRIGQVLREARIDGLVCALPENVLMISGYWPVVGTSVALVNRDGQVAILAPEDEKDLAECAEADSLSTFRPGSLDRLETTAKAVREPFEAALRALGLEAGIVGCESGPMLMPASYVSMHLYGAAIFRLLRESFTSGTLADADRWLARLKSVKTEIEIDRIRRACRIAECAFLQGSAALHPGLKETEAAALFGVPLSTQGTGFEGVDRAGGSVFCMSGPNAGQAFGAYARSRARILEVADLALIHGNSYADGYWTDITRTYVMGEPNARQQDLYAAVFAARQAALDAIRPGVKASAVDRAARGVLEQRGFGAEFKHAAGHGAGYAAIDHNALPRLHPRSPDLLECGMVFNLEPGIYLDGAGGLRHCDLIAVTENGAEVLTPFQTDMEALIR